MLIYPTSALFIYQNNKSCMIGLDIPAWRNVCSSRPVQGLPPFAEQYYCRHAAQGGVGCVATCAPPSAISHETTMGCYVRNTPFTCYSCDPARPLFGIRIPHHLMHSVLLVVRRLLVTLLRDSGRRSPKSDRSEGGENLKGDFCGGG